MVGDDPKRRLRHDRLWPAVVLSTTVHAAVLCSGAWARPQRVSHGHSFISARLVRLGGEQSSTASGEHEFAPHPRFRSGRESQATVANRPASFAGDRAVRAERTRAAQPGDAAGSPLSRVMAGPGASVATGRWTQIPGGAVYEEPDVVLMQAERYVTLAAAALLHSAQTQSPRAPSAVSCRGLDAIVNLLLEPDGEIAAWSFVSRSGNSVCDQEIEAAVRGATLSPPPEEMREVYRTAGMRLTLRM